MITGENCPPKSGGGFGKGNFNVNFTLKRKRCYRLNDILYALHTVDCTEVML